jgi:hypothetical protein
VCGGVVSCRVQVEELQLMQMLDDAPSTAP